MLILLVAGAVKFAVFDVDVVRDDTVAGRGDDEAFIPTVLKIGSTMPVLAVASGPIVNGKPKIAQSSATEEKVTATQVSGRG